MQVNSISANRPAFKSMSDIETLASLDENQVRQLAYAKTSAEVNDKKHRRIGNTIYYTTPLVAGLASAADNPGKILATVKTVAGDVAKTVNLSRAARLGSFLSTTALWATGYMVADAVFGSKHIIEKHSPALKEFSQNHPFLSSVVGWGVAIAGTLAAYKGGAKLIGKLPKGTFDKVSVAVAEKLNASKVLNKVSEKIAKVPSGIKTFGKSMISFAPWIMIFAGMSHNVDHESVKARDLQKNYQDLKLAQAVAREKLNAEDSAEIE